MREDSHNVALKEGKRVLKDGNKASNILVDMDKSIFIINMNIYGGINVVKEFWTYSLNVDKENLIMELRDEYDCNVIIENSTKTIKTFSSGELSSNPLSESNAKVVADKFRHICGSDYVNAHEFDESTLLIDADRDNEELS